MSIIAVSLVSTTTLEVAAAGCAAWTVAALRAGEETGLALLGHRAELMPEAPAAGDVGTWLDGFLFSLAGPIYAGTNEIQRNVIAERVLGMPRK